MKDRPTIRKFKLAKTSKRTELWYKRNLLALVRELRAKINTAFYQPEKAWLNQTVNDELAFDIDRFLSSVKHLKGIDTEAIAVRLAENFVKIGNVQNAVEVGNNLQRQIGLDLTAYLNGNEKVAERVQQLTQANIALIKSIPSQYLDKVMLAVTQAQIKGLPTSELAKEIQKIGKITENRAMLIARDQSSKLNAALTQARHESLGVLRYEWSTSGDERVRDSHSEKDGQIFEYAHPPEDTGHPGHDINCRCVQIPVFDTEDRSGREKIEPSNEVNSPQKTGKMELDELIERSIDGGGNKSFSDIGTIHPNLVELAKESIGLDISDWQHSVDEAGIRHTFKQHGNEKTESSRGQRAVTKKDILLLPMIISQFDSIEYAGTSDLGNETFLIRKEIGDEIYTIQEIRKKHKKLTMKTMWIRKKSAKIKNRSTT